MRCLLAYFQDKSAGNYGYMLLLYVSYIRNLVKKVILLSDWGLRGCDRMAVGFTTTFAISAYHH
jgi:hypothetical protein